MFFQNVTNKVRGQHFTILHLPGEGAPGQARDTCVTREAVQSAREQHLESQPYGEGGRQRHREPGV